MNCKQCKERLSPDNPEQPQWNPHTSSYLKPLCFDCSDYREPEVIKKVIEPEWAYGQWQVIQQLQGEVRHIHTEVHEKKPKAEQYEYH
jgi:hypothetical protein